MKQRVTEMIKAEMATFQKPDYLAALPAVEDPTFGGSAFLQAEYARVAAGRARSDGEGISTRHYEACDMPEGPAMEDPAAWESACDAARIRLEAQELHSVNLELLGKYGAAAWKGAAATAEGRAAAAQAALKRLETSTADVNKARRAAQDHRGGKLSAARAGWVSAVDSTFQLRVAIAELEGQMASAGAQSSVGGSMD